MTARLFDGRSALDRPVLVRIDNAALELRELRGAVIARWPVASLRRCDNDAPGTGALLRRLGGAERLALADPELLRRLQAGGARLGRRGRSSGGWVGLGVGLLGSLGVATLLVDRLPSLALPFVPRALEHQWSNGIEAVLETGTRRCEAPAGLAALGGLITTLARAAGISPVPRFIVLDDESVNAFTLPDGRLVILHGLIAKVADADEMAGVLAHELGHVAHRDPTREMLRDLELNMLARSLGWGGGLGSQMARLSYGRRAEAGADASAVVTLQRAGLRADGLGRFFERLRALNGSDAGFAFLSDHPTTAARIAAVRTGTAGSPSMTTASWTAVRIVCD